MGLRESDLYAPVKALLEGQGYVVKGEIGALDVMAVRGDEPPVIVELKVSFTLGLVHQGVARQGLSDHVYLAVPPGKHATNKRNTGLCRRLGLGLIFVRPADGHVIVACDPAPYSPRTFPKRTARLLREFARLEGDPNVGGGTRQGLMTAYRQDAQRIADALEDGPLKCATIRKASGVDRATPILADNHYGWFERVSRGVYELSPNGKARHSAKT
ncbi:DUF2161 domain-containing phosphodiesterase [Palleronia sp. THAF1]|uniref:DUF2161 domain-containing phosphodiesterase n=1 Tax=Palleronia sp. THAF1 TaxID=2587842 RepID=UPI000F51C417|nr:DUF2161 family putative PD-(D/E)XK-type phosphodiesterase [Palleronia sp. THAF1]